ncbi:MAG: hypothetical protein EP332_13085 [Bacteroidetes bacterium]|nr:MAG: hypothetical protein EP332_13085 [Bacteroidota bacterium]
MWIALSILSFLFLLALGMLVYELWKAHELELMLQKMRMQGLLPPSENADAGGLNHLMQSLKNQTQLLKRILDEGVEH